MVSPVNIVQHSRNNEYKYTILSENTRRENISQLLLWGQANTDNSIYKDNTKNKVTDNFHKHRPSSTILLNNIQQYINKDNTM